MGLTKMYTKCEKCEHKDNCNKKRMMACGYIGLNSMSGEMISQNNSMNMAIPLVNIQSDILEKHLNKICLIKFRTQI